MAYMPRSRTAGCTVAPDGRTPNFRDAKPVHPAGGDRSAIPAKRVPAKRVEFMVTLEGATEMA
jgi:hypothetical protein